MWLRVWSGILICLLAGIAPIMSDNFLKTTASQEEAIPFGEYISPSDGSTLILTEQADGTIHMSISIYRLTMQDDGVGVYQAGKLVVIATDASGQPMTWHLSKEGDVLKARVAVSSWALLPAGECFQFQPLVSSGDGCS